MKTPSRESKPAKVFFLPAQSITWLRHLATWLAIEKASDGDLVVVDISNLMLPTRSQLFSKLPGLGFEARLRRALEDSGARYIAPMRVSSLSRGSSPELDYRSWLGTLYRTEDPESAFTYRKNVVRLSRRLASAGPKFSLLLRELTPKEVVVPSGRTPASKLLASISEQSGASIRFVENSWRYGGSFFSEFPTNAKHESDVQFFAFNSRSRVQGESYLADRTQKTGSNPFSRDFDSSNQVPDFQYVFFTSSVDEFSDLGQEWDNHDWKDQYDAFETILESIGSDGSKAAIRVHPNLANKALRQKMKECKRLSAIKGRFPKITIYSHISHVNSYHLARNSKISVVSRSTLSMELTALGVRVVTVFPNYFSEKLNLPAVYSPKSLSEFDFDSITVPDTDEAKRLAEYLMVRSVVWGKDSYVLDNLDPTLPGALRRFRFSYLPSDWTPAEILRYLGFKLGRLVEPLVLWRYRSHVFNRVWKSASETSLG